MSVTVSELVWSHGPVKMSENLVLLCLADHADKHGLSCYPSVPRIMQRTRLGRRTVQIAIAALSGTWLERVPGNGRGHRSDFRLNLAYLKARQKSEPESQRIKGADRAVANSHQAMPDEAKGANAAQERVQMLRLKGANAAQPPDPLKGVTVHNRQIEPPSFALRHEKAMPTMQKEEDSPSLFPTEALTSPSTALVTRVPQRARLPVEPAPDKPDNRVILGTFPCVGKRKSWGFTAQQVEEWSSAYPGVDLMQELRAARMWLIANPRQIKTFTGMPRFLNNWLNTAQNKAGGFHHGHGSRSARPVPGTRAAGNFAVADGLLSRIEDKDRGHTTLDGRSLPAIGSGA